MEFCNIKPMAIQRITRPFFKLNVVKNQEPVKVEPKKFTWVNGECLEKIQFPCFCSFVSAGREYIGQLNKAFYTGDVMYELHDISKQTKGINRITGCADLEYLMKQYKVHILKGEYTIYREIK